ncbi:OTU-domain-containing protein [Saitoella complicata NRRL Y-17804]|uniref:OTU-domain-containing protein n=1 Tax=Saitoella complicata (strain BCRC 22490 / CBS 7301 / JCM 7358 / NBRC 10748 / NRRL Y-17804) TaxID=698492 RepID=UPI000867DDFC|nr:OTU-domain-containing protein [Saitoella complicata NRRL Y-17804]ODQ56486.1 OTU-domain-containing protein [Saitoella complicata NRRL Y-17804]
MRVRLRHRLGQQTLTLAEDTTLAQLWDKVSDITSSVSFTVKTGYPPKALSFDEPLRLIRDVGVKSGEQLVVEDHDAPKPPLKKPSPPASAPTSSGSGSGKGAANENDPPEVTLKDGRRLALRVMPDDNSCLFRALTYVLPPSPTLSAPALRQHVAAYIASHPDEYPEVVLGKPPPQYCAWIERSESWGGAIEMAILSKEFGVEIASVDVGTGRVDRFNEEAGRRCLVVYSGIHYDALALSPVYASPGEHDQTLFDVGSALGDEVLQAAQELVGRLKGKGYYTDTANFSLRCSVCRVGLKGEKEAVKHAEGTGHGAFEEY